MAHNWSSDWRRVPYYTARDRISLAADAMGALFATYSTEGAIARIRQCAIYLTESGSHPMTIIPVLEALLVSASRCTDTSTSAKIREAHNQMRESRWHHVYAAFDHRPQFYGIISCDDDQTEVIKA